MVVKTHYLQRSGRFAKLRRKTEFFVGVLQNGLLGEAQRDVQRPLRWVESPLGFRPNGLQAGPVCSLKQCLPKCLFKDTNVCCFCKNEKLVCRNFLQKLLPRPRKLGLLGVIACAPHIVLVV